MKLLVWLVFLLWPASALGLMETVVIPADPVGGNFGDAQMDSSAVIVGTATWNRGGDVALNIGTQGALANQWATAWYRSWLYWDVTQTLPRFSDWDREWCAIDSVKLRLYVQHAPAGAEAGESADTLLAYPVKKGMPVEGTGIGGDSTFAGITWIDRDGSGDAPVWLIPGGDSVMTSGLVRFGQHPWTRHEIALTDTTQDRTFPCSFAPYADLVIDTWFEVDVTDIQLAWNAGLLANYGIIIADAHPGIHGDSFGASPTEAEPALPGPDQGHLGFGSREAPNPWQLVFYVRRVQPMTIIGMPGIQRMRY